MIPKIIHYCWFGKNPYPPSVVECLESWKKYCPDYKIIEWNEENFDINCNIYVEQAYKAKKWAFVSDYARLYAIYTYGGIYMDTDVEVIKPLDSFLSDKAFSGFEAQDRVPTAIMGCCMGHPFFKMLLDDYKNRTFICSNGTYDYTTNVATITKLCVQEGLKLDNTKQTVCNFTLYPKDYFCPKDNMTYKLNLTKNSVTIHHFNNSWMTKGQKRKKKIIAFLGPKMTQKIVTVKHFLQGIKD